MIAVGTIIEYGIQGRKIRELKDFLAENIQQRTVNDENEYKKMKHFIKRRVTELNAQFPNTVAVSFVADDPFTLGRGTFRFVRQNASTAIIYLTVLVVKPYTEGGVDGV